jgi:RNA-directed DNA polymerase
VVQAVLKLVLEPIFEVEFQSWSHAFRPNRRAQDAIAEIQYLATRGYTVGLRGRHRCVFDTIDHVALMDRLRVQISDKNVLALVKASLKAGVMTTTGDRDQTLTGTPQGGIQNCWPRWG